MKTSEAFGCLQKKILITGGTGFIGKNLCEMLITQGAKVFVLTRKQNQSPGNISFISSIEEIHPSKVDIIINLAGEPIAQRWTALAKQRIEKSRISITSSIINYIKISPWKPSLFISASAIGYYGTHETIEFDEQTHPVEGHTFPKKLCKAWEDEAIKAEHYGVRTALLRIGAVLETDGGILAKLLPVFRLGLGGPIGQGCQWLSWIHREDLLRLMLHIIDTPSLQGPINATAPNPVSNSEFSKALAETLHRPCFMGTPGWILRGIFGEMANEIMLKGQKVFPKKALESQFVFLYPTLKSSLEKILRRNMGPN